MATSVNLRNLDPELMKRLRSKAVEEGITLRDLIIRSLTAAVEDNQQSKPEKKRTPTAPQPAPEPASASPSPAPAEIRTEPSPTPKLPQNDAPSAPRTQPKAKSDTPAPPKSPASAPNAVHCPHGLMFHPGCTE